MTIPDQSRYLETSVPRTILNKASDTNSDGVITLGELKNTDKAFLSDLSNESGFTTIIQDVNLVLNQYKNFNNENQVVFNFLDDEYQSFMKYSTDEGNDISLVSPETIMKKSNNNEQLGNFINWMKYNNIASNDNMFFLDKICSIFGLEKSGEISDRLSNFISIESNQLTKEDKLKLVGDILHDIALPSDISQGQVGSCTAAAIQMKLAILDPLKYVDITTSLVTNQKYVSENGGYLIHNKTYLKDPSDSRSLSCKIMQNTLMDYGHRKNNDVIPISDGVNKLYYDSSFSIDTAQGLFNETKSSSNLGGGLGSKAGNYVEELLFSTKFKDLKHNTSSNINQDDNLDIFGFRPLQKGNTKIDLLNKINNNLDKNIPVSVSFSDHAVLVTNRENINGIDTYTIYSWGAKYEITLNDLLKSMYSARV